MRIQERDVALHHVAMFDSLERSLEALGEGEASVATETTVHRRYQDPDVTIQGSIGYKIQVG